MSWRVYVFAGSLIVMLMMVIVIQHQHGQIQKYKTASVQNAEQLKMCVAQYSKNQEIIDEYQENVDNLNRRISSLKLRYGSVCTPVVGGTTNNHEAANNGHVQRNGVPLGKLLDYGAWCERIRLQLNSAQRYIGEK